MNIQSFHHQTLVGVGNLVVSVAHFNENYGLVRLEPLARPN